MSAITRISATKLESYISCPYRYYLKYVKGMGRRAMSNSYMLFGTTIHKILEDFHKYVASCTLPEDETKLRPELASRIERIALQRLSELQMQEPIVFRVIRKTPKEAFTGYIVPYFEMFMANKWYARRFDPEWRFKMKLEDIAQTLQRDELHPQTLQYTNVVVEGKIDLVLYPSKIIDFKTSAKPDSMANLHKSFQTGIYTLLFDKDIDFTYMYLSGGKIVNRAFKILQKNRIKRFNEIVQFLHMIDKTPRYIKNPKSCSMCLFKHICRQV